VTAYPDSIATPLAIVKSGYHSYTRAMTVRFRLAELLGARSRYDLAQASGVSYPTVAAMYHNRAKGVTLEVLGKIADELGVEPGELFERDGKRGGKR
jgi:putative transcriptional regulator